MRLRKKHGTIEKITAEIGYFISEPKDFIGNWQKAFPSAQPLMLEIGMGGGKFLSSQAVKNPTYNYLGIEKQEELLEFAIQKAKIHDLKNLKLLWYNAERLGEIFEENEIAHLYLNFSDPWPKTRHAKRRLTSIKFLESYHKILKPNGILEIKTDNGALFEFSVNELLNKNWSIEKISIDLHSKEYFDGIMTEYEDRFSALGEKIYYIKARVTR